MKDYFPSKLAKGTQFCNRLDEKKLLHENIEQCRHSVLIAPRRYGKSSLVLKVANESMLPLASIDLFLAHDDAAVTKRIFDGIGQVISHIMPQDKKLLMTLERIFKHFRVSLNMAGFSIDAGFSGNSFDPVDQIFNALEGLNDLAKQQKRQAIIFIDEFQDISQANSSKSIQGAIRHIAQESENLVFIFSGSNRRLLMELFDDSTQPLYMLCDLIHLKRMSSTSYLPHLQKFAKRKWGKHLSEIVFEKIVSLTELHPYYVNLLCHELWKKKRLPTREDVLICWDDCSNQHEDRFIAELEKLTLKQQSILKTLAISPTVEPTGQHFVSASKTPASTISQSIRVLLNKDMVYKVKQLDDHLPKLQLNQHRVLDPLLAYVLRKYC